MTAAILDRLRTLVAALAPEHAVPHTTLEAVYALEPTVHGDRNLWLVLAGVRGEYPDRFAFTTFRRRVEIDGAQKALTDLVGRSRDPWRNRAQHVEIVQNEVLVDVHHTARTGLATGIQRVVRQTIQQWTSDRRIRLVGWDPRFRGLRTLTEPEARNALHGDVPGLHVPRHSALLLPRDCSYVLPELAIESERTARIGVFAEFSGCSTTAIGFDCVPLTTAETVGAGMGAAFAKNLAALARFDRVVTISQAAAIEYRGWRRMLSGAGLEGPDIVPVVLPAVAESVTQEQMDAAAHRLRTTDAPLVVCVGSHEPRKNHLALLYAAELLWREGLDFELVFIGGNSWNSGEFVRTLARLEEAGRPVRAISAVSDALLWSAYRLARVTVFPSLNEGFGLPVAESLAVGTPVITSKFGSMAEIAEGGGAILVDPRDDDDIVRGLRLALTDDAEIERLGIAASTREMRTWNDYAAEVWQQVAQGAARLTDAKTA